MLGIDIDPDRHALNADPDPDPAKRCGSDVRPDPDPVQQHRQQEWKKCNNTSVLYFGRYRYRAAFFPQCPSTAPVQAS